MRSFPLVVVISLTACSSAETPTVDEASGLTQVAHGAYVSLAVVSDAYPSAIAPTNRVELWVSAADVADYARIEPDRSGSGATVPAGTLIVREVQDNGGAITKLTLMVKGPPGYNPDLGDFWFGVTAPDGTPLWDNGAQQLGRLTACYGCHQQRSADGFLFGVPPAWRR
jgi:hypothetical protein